MADVRALPGIRYTSGDLAALVTPPYDVISPEAQARYYERHPENIIRLELGRDEPGDDELDNRYTRAAVTFAEWRLRGILAQDVPSLYLYEQRFAAQERDYTRLSLLARVRLEPWEAGVILPHERTLSKPKDDRLKLYRACAANLSPIMALYDDPQSELAETFIEVRRTTPIADFTDEAGEGHRLWLIPGAETALEIATFFRERRLYIADGHHRYETGLAYRDEVAQARKELLDDDAANFTLMALSAIEDPGLLVLPTHRLLRDLPAARLAALDERLRDHFTVTPLASESDGAALMEQLAAASQTGAQTAFVLVRPEDALLLTLRDEGRDAMTRLEGVRADASDAWRRLDLAVLHELVFNRAVGVTDEQVRVGEHVSYTRDANSAVHAVRERADGTQLAVLVNATPPAAIRDVARAGDRMPQKSTYFYPKLITGLVINPLW
ncbi:MAG: DUF1015 domain-containing protein [Ktedonobacterales bacterium]